MSGRKEVLFTNLGEICEPAKNISKTREFYKWASVPYETKDIKGNMLLSLQKGRPEDVRLNPGLTGWYRIMVGQYSCNQYISLKLTSDKGFAYVAPGNAGSYGSHSIEEVYWKAADMTGESVVIHKHVKSDPYNAAIAWMRFVPMDDAEVAAF